MRNVKYLIVSIVLVAILFLISGVIYASTNQVSVGTNPVPALEKQCPISGCSGVDCTPEQIKAWKEGKSCSKTKKFCSRQKAIESGTDI